MTKPYIIKRLQLANISAMKRKHRRELAALKTRQKEEMEVERELHRRQKVYRKTGEWPRGKK